MVVPARFERATFRFGGEHSIQLSYGTMFLCYLWKSQISTQMTFV